MDTLKQFSEKKENYDLYQARQAYILQQNTMEYDLEQALQAKEQAHKDVEQALKSEQQSRQEAQRLKNLLKKHGIDPNEV